MNGQQQGQQQQQIAKRQHLYQESRQQYVEVPYERREFPKWKYQEGKEPMLVNSREEEKALGPEWRDEPIVTAKGDSKTVDAGELRRENEELKRQLAGLRKPSAESEKQEKVSKQPGGQR